jgi:hypothetical protein
VALGFNKVNRIELGSGRNAKCKVKNEICKIGRTPTTRGKEPSAAPSWWNVKKFLAFR